MKRRNLWPRSAVAALAVLSLAGCAGVGVLGDVLGGISGRRVSGEVRWVDERRREIEVRTSYGRSEIVEFDRNTRVIHGQRRYSVSALEPGDGVSMQVQRDQRGGLYTDLIYVERSTRDGRAATGSDAERGRDEDRRRTQSFQGRVVRIDHRQGWFELEGERRASYLVTLPYRPDSEVTRRFRRLRTGDHVRVEGELLNRDRVELRRFR